MDSQTSADIRQWARGQGHELGDRGRIPGHIVSEYAREHRMPDGWQGQPSGHRTGKRQQKTRRAYLAATPIVLCNAVAVTGQFLFARTHLPTWGLPGDLLFAGALESIAVYLAYSAHEAQLADDSSLRLRLASYLYGLMIGAINYGHYASFQHPNSEAIAVGLMSASSPWLWAIFTRRMSRDALRRQGLIEGHAVRLGATRTLWHPVRSVQALWLATWHGETDPQAAIALYEDRSGERRTARELSRIVLEAEDIPAGNGALALAAGPEPGDHIILACGHKAIAKGSPRFGTMLHCNRCGAEVPYADGVVIPSYEAS